MKGTRLWQAPGSPIIQGRSRTERPFWERWVGGVVGAELIVFAVALVFVLWTGDAPLSTALPSVMLSYMVPALPGCVVGAALGVWMSRTMGWRRHWLVGSIAGAAMGALTIALL